MSSEGGSRYGLQPFSVTAYNYAEQSSNRIHDGVLASQYGFRGGLVPGVALFAYMTVPVMERFGSAWLDGGQIAGRFLKPVYDGDAVEATAIPAPGTTEEFDLALSGAEGTLHAVGHAARSSLWKDSAGPWEGRPAPAEPERLVPSLDVVVPGLALGAIEFIYGTNPLQGEFGADFLTQMRNPLGLYASEHVWHPAFPVHLANALLMANIALGPWIHTESNVRYVGWPVPGSLLRVWGSVQQCGLRRGHHWIEVLASVGGADGTVFAHVRHGALIHLAGSSEGDTK